MPRLTYISRRQGGVYYLQIRLPRALGAGTKLWRCSLSTTKARQAQRAILPYLRWLLDMKDAKTVEQLIDSVLTQIDEFMRSGPAQSEWDMRLRLAVLYRLQDYLDEWTKADPCPIEYAALYRRLPELKEAQIHLGALVTADSEFFPEPLNEEDDTKLLKSYRSPLLYNHGREWVYVEAMANAKENGEDVEDAAYRCASNELNGSEAQDIAARYFENVRRPNKADSASAASAAPLSGNSAAQWRDTYASTSPPTHWPVQTAGPGAGKRLSEAKELYLEFKKNNNGDRRADEDTGPVIDFLIDSVGDVPINSLTPEVFIALDSALAKIPVPKGIPKESRHSLKGRYDHALKRGWDGLQTMSVTRVKVWHVNLKQFFGWLRDVKLYVGPEPAFRTLPKNLRKAQSRAQFSDEELLRLFSLPLFTGSASKVNFWMEGKQFVQNQLYWAYVIMFFTGMRPSEICSLRTSDIKTDGNGKWIFDLDVEEEDANEIQRKTENAKRKIPVHAVLIDLGLIARKIDLEKAGTLRLFPEWGDDYVKPSGQRKPGHYFSKSWQYLTRHHGFQRTGLTLYGLRHTRAAFFDLLDLSSRHRKLLLGHALVTVDEKYGGEELSDTELEKLRNLPLNKIEKDVREILLAAKRKADSGQLEVVKTWLNVRPSIKRKPLPAIVPAAAPTR